MSSAWKLGPNISCFQHHSLLQPAQLECLFEEHSSMITFSMYQLCSLIKHNNQYFHTFVYWMWDCTQHQEAWRMEFKTFGCLKFFILSTLGWSKVKSWGVLKSWSSEVSENVCFSKTPCMNNHILSYSPILLDPRLVDPRGSNIVTDGCVITILFWLHSRQTCVLSGCGGADLLWLGVEDCQTRDWAPH